LGISKKSVNLKILIIGSGGFLGGWVKNLLQNSNEHLIEEIPGKNFVDITKEDEFDSFIKSSKPDIVINCAAFVGGIAYGYKYPSKILNLNSKMALNLYSVLNKNNVNLLINPISNCAYPKHLTTYKEEDFFSGPPHESVYNYAVAKRLFVNLGNSYQKEFKFNSVNVILSNMYGQDDHFDIERSHALGALVKKICDAKISGINKVEIWGSGKPIREWLHVSDGARALIMSTYLSKGHHFFNVGVNKGISIKDLALEIKNAAKWDGEFTYNLEKPDGVLEKKVDGSNGKKFIKWEPEVDLKSGIKDTVEWYFKNKI